MRPTAPPRWLTAERRNTRARWSVTLLVVVLALVMGCKAATPTVGASTTAGGAAQANPAASGAQASSTGVTPNPFTASGSVVSATSGGATTSAAPKIFAIVKEVGFMRPFENASPVLTSGPFAMQITFTPYPPAERTDLEILVLDDRRGEPVEGAQVVARADMPGHGHGIAAIRLEDRGGGRHGTPIILFMGGDWAVDLEIRKGAAKGLMTLLISTPLT